MVSYFENYGPYVPLVQNGYMELNVSELTKENYNDHFNGILNIMRDGIEDPEVQALKIGVTLSDGNFLRLTLTDYWFNLIFWTFPIYIRDPITPKYLIDTRAITKKTIRNYFNIFIKEHSIDIDFITLNNLLDETIYKLKYIDEFAQYLANTVNFKDTLDLMQQYPDFNAAIHADLTGVPIEDVKAVGMEYAQTQIGYIKANDHCLRDSFVSQEAINPKQFKEVSVNIGTKPDGRGGIFPYIINNSFMNGGVSNPESYVIDSSIGRTAQILSKMNTGTSGSFARLLETNNLDTFFNEDPEFSCNTRNYIKIFIQDKTWLSLYDKRFVKMNPNGVEHCVDMDKDTDLIGKWIYARSPITCESFARGEGICRKCYGNLYFVNRDINPGKYASENLSSKLTQKLLSAKHLLESSVIEMKWNPEFNDLFEVNINTILLQEDINVDGMYMIIDAANVSSNDDDDDSDESGISYDEYIPYFDIMYPDGSVVTFHTADEDNIYLTEDLNKLMKSKKVKENDGIYTIPLELTKTLTPIFTVKIQNKELQGTLEKMKHIINRDKDTATYTKDEIVKEFIASSIEGDINVSAIHLETIIANQIRDQDNILEMPKWTNPNAKYKILTLGSALANSPSITVNLQYQRIGRTLVSPISTKKTKPSIFDLYFMEQPQKYVVDRSMISNDYEMKEDEDYTIKDAVYFESDKSND